MFMYLTAKDFNINKSKLLINCKDNVIILLVYTPKCPACTVAKKTFDDLHDVIPNVSFALLNIDKHTSALQTMNVANIHITHTPTFMLFKLGVFQDFINVKSLTKEDILKALVSEQASDFLNPKNNKIKTQYTLFSDM